jgi:arylsulfatase I/J
VQTPNLDSLVAQGIELTQMYTFKYCSPTRSALQSGRNPIHVNILNTLGCHNPNRTDTAGYSGIALNMSTLPEKMRKAGYIPHAVGKWDVGGATLRQTPAGRGYESWLGYWSACNDYWNFVPKCGPSTCAVNGGAPVPMVDFWEQDRRQPPVAGSGAPFLSRPARAQTNNLTCTQKQQQGCAFEDDVLLHRAQTIVRAHAASEAVEPLFLYWATHAAHGPREVPQATLDKFAFIDWNARKTYAGLVAHLDDLVGQMVTTLSESNLWKNTLLVWSSDNGGDDQANNYPQRGAKFSNWQGGIHVAAFVSGGALPPSRRGIKLGGLVTAWDLFATLSVAGGLSASEAVADGPAALAGLPAVDAISQWDYWRGSTAVAPRTEVAIGGEVGDENGGSSGVRFTGPTAKNTGVEALIVSLPASDGNDAETTEKVVRHVDEGGRTLYKLMVGTFHEAMWTGPQWPNKSSTSFSTNHSHWAVTADCRRGCLYDLSNDPNEHVDLAPSKPDIVAKLRSRLESINSTVFSPDRGPPLGHLKCQVAVEKYGGFFGPFLDLH